MKNKVLYFVLFLFSVVAFYSCQEKIAVDFTYSPEQPRIGEKITFTNLSSKGEDFDWNFGNNTISRAKNPTKTYTVPGVYTVTLRVDSGKHNVKSKVITVYDSIPTITRSSEQVNYYEEVEFGVLVYNPYKRAKTYKWFFSKNAEGESLRDTTIMIEDGSLADVFISNEEKPVVFFKQKNIEEAVRLHMTVGDSIYEIAQIKKNTFTVIDVPTRSLLMARKDNKILRQRIYSNGIEASEETTILSGKNPFSMIVYGEQLFIFDIGTDIWPVDNSLGDGVIRMVNLSNNTEKVIANNQGLSSRFGFYNGYVNETEVFWSDFDDNIYKIKKSDFGNPFVYPSNYVSVSKLSNGMQSGQKTSGFWLYNDIYFWGKADNGKGIYRFKDGDIGSGSVPQSGVILADYSIRAFAIDRINAQIYFSSDINPINKNGLFVSNIDGTNVRQIDVLDNTTQFITSVLIDNYANMVFWACRAPQGQDGSGVKQMKLVRKGQNPTDITYFNQEKNVYGLALDNVAK